MDESFLDMEIIQAASMSEEDLKKCPQVLAAVAFVTYQSRILIVFNEKWGRFTLPMTKVKNTFIRNDGYLDAANEDWAAESRKAAYEHLAPGSADHGKYLMVLDDFMRSERDTATKRYTLGVYHFAVTNPNLPDMTGRQWLTSEETMRDVAPLMSQSALRVVNQMIESKVDLGLPI